MPTNVRSKPVIATRRPCSAAPPRRASCPEIRNEKTLPVAGEGCRGTACYFLTAVVMRSKFRKALRDFLQHGLDGFLRSVGCVETRIAHRFAQVSAQRTALVDRVGFHAKLHAHHGGTLAVIRELLGAHVARMNEDDGVNASLMRQDIQRFRIART